MALITLAEFKATMGISDSTNDSLYTALIAHADALIKKRTRRNLESATFTQIYSGNGSIHLFLKETPVTGVSSIYLNNSAYWDLSAFTSSHLLVAGTDYAVQWNESGLCVSGIVRRLNGVWPGAVLDSPQRLVHGPEIQQGNIKVTYTAGYATIPSDLKWAASLIVKQAVNSLSGGGPMQSESHEYYSYSLASASSQINTLVNSDTTINRYVRPIV